ncbi:hypothetical protein [Sphingomonas sp. PP-CE-1G-424]|uniref:hypothetical protein n=1 Tax=Sphingomonas sp. PP-CE-1G-424 TaxID=2135658 RepID=UPI0010554054|nr:hypothetical protein [Sphingomonas sp. PP-CE-1G-424]
MLFHERALDVWAKLDWETNEFKGRISSAPPIDIDGCVYLLQSACISAVAVIDWLRHDLQQAAGGAGTVLDEGSFRLEVDVWLPDLSLARAIANTFKHREYRDEGWGAAEARLITLFEPEQHARLDATHGTDRFSEAFAEEAAEATFMIAFGRKEDRREVNAIDFMQQLSAGALRLLDANPPDDDRLFKPPADSSARRGNPR